MHRTCRLILLTVFLALPLCSGAQAQTFEDLVEDALKRQRAGQEPAPGETAPAPLFPQPGQAAPAPLFPQPGQETAAPPPGAPPAPAFKPVELGPRPYTPPVVDTPAEGGAQPPSGGAASSSTPATAPSASTAAPTPTAATPAPATPSEPALQPGGAAGTAGTITPPPATALVPGAERARESLTAAEVNGAIYSEEALAVGGANPLVLKAQVLLDRAGASPGVIDGYPGGNLARAVSAVETVLKLEADGKLDLEVWTALRGDATQDVLVQYTINEQDLAYPFAAAIPDDYAQQAALPSLSYASPEEMLAERFHIDERLLKALNPDVDFRQAGTSIWVASVESAPVSGKVARIVADKGRGQLRGYDAQGRLVVAYPASIGSADNPAPSGDMRVEAVTPNPVFIYDPGTLASLVGSGKLTLRPGPNNPLGSTWIGLSAPDCGIHGAPDPNKVGKTPPNGCVRLTNWDAEELAGLVEPGTVVSFLD